MKIRRDDYLDLVWIQTTCKYCLMGIAAWVGILIVLTSLTYFPPQFSTGFLKNRQSYFHGWYSVAFYSHVLSAPLVLFLGLFQFVHRVRVAMPALHAALGKTYVYLALGVAIPSGLAISLKTNGTSSAVTSFIGLGVATFVSVLIGALSARKRDFKSHSVWMRRGFLLMSSAVILRILAEVTIYFRLEHIFSYTDLVWLSWLPLIVVHELIMIFQIWIWQRPQRTKSI